MTGSPGAFQPDLWSWCAALRARDCQADTRETWPALRRAGLLCPRPTSQRCCSPARLRRRRERAVHPRRV